MSNLDDLDRNYLKDMDNIDFNPIFILGLARSGTTIIYNLLSLTKSFNYLSFYDIFYYDQLIFNHINKKEKSIKKKLNERLEKQNILNRGIDNIKVNADLTEEYQFLLFKKTNKRQLCQKNVPIFLEMAKKIQFIAENNKPLILKNPVDFPNFIFLKKTFPNAKFIFIHRDPIRILNSTLITGRYLYTVGSDYYSKIDLIYDKIYKNPLSRFIMKNYYSSYSVIGLIDTSNHTKNAIKYFISNINKIPEEDYINIKYEDLCKLPNYNVAKVMNFLSLKSKEKIDFNSFISPRNLPMSKKIMIFKKMFCYEIGEYLDLFGYDKMY